ncbi:MAG: glycosyl hydrolase family 28 protein [Agriterribacter sp.]
MSYIKILIIVFVLPFSLSAKDYNASLFGVKSDGLTLNTRSIQKGIDFISEHGGGRLVFYVGRYLTGSVKLKSNVTIKLEEGAVLVGSPSIYDYNSSGSIKAVICADGQENIGISGKGVIEGRGALLLKNMNDLSTKGFLLDSLTKQPALLGFNNCTGVQIDSVNMVDAAGAVQVFNKCNNLSVAAVVVKSKSNPDATGIIFIDSKNIKLINNYIEVEGKSLQWSGDVKELMIEKTIDSKGSLISAAP